jgi:hypothetical protein
MKKTMFLLAFGFAAITANAQKMKEADVPPSIKAGFSKLYPAAKVDKWEKEKSNYEAEFHDGKTEMSVLLGPNGQLLETEKEINATQLPKAATDYVAKNLAGKKIKEAAQITDAKGIVTYEAEVDEADYIFDANGTFLKKEVEAPDGDKD